MEYSVRPGTLNQGQDYEVAITALLVMRCINQHDGDLWAAFNIDGVGDFDDLALTTTDPKGKQHTYLIQIKHKVNPTPIIKREMLMSSSRNDYYIGKYKESYNTLQTLKTSQHENAKILKKLPPPDCIDLILYTNRPLQEHEFLVESDHFLNITGNVYKITEITLNGEKVDKRFLERFYLITDQPGLDNFNSHLINEIAFFFDSPHLSLHIYNRIATEYLNFIREWAKGNLGGQYLLTRDMIIGKLLELIFHPYFPKFHMRLWNEENKFKVNVWQTITCDKSVIIVGQDKLVDEFLFVHVVKSVQEQFEQPPKFVAWFELFEHDEIEFFSKNFTSYKTNNYVNFATAYNVLWKSGKLPLILEIDNKQFFDFVTKMVRKYKPKLRLIIIHKSDNDIKFDKRLGFVSTLDDLNKKYITTITKNRVVFQNKIIKLDNILEIENCFSYITIQDLIHILSSDFVIGGETNQLPPFYIQQSLPKVLIDFHIFSDDSFKTNNDVFLVRCKKKGLLPRFLKYMSIPLNHDAVISYNDVMRNNDKIGDGIKLVLAKPNYFKKLCDKNKSKTIHSFMWNDKNNVLEWYSTRGSVKNIQPFRINDDSQSCGLVNGEDAFSHFTGKLCLISAGPGMGKSTFMMYLYLKIPSTYWVCRIDLNQYLDYYDSDDFTQNNNSPDDHIRYFSNQIISKHGYRVKLNSIIFENYFKVGKVVLILDGFDEISPGYKDQVTTMIKTLQETNCKLWLTTRPVLQSHAENIFSTLSLNLSPFTKNDQQIFLNQYFVHELSISSEDCEKINLVSSFSKRLLYMMERNLNDSTQHFTAAPLHLTLIGQVFLKDCRHYIETKQFILDDKFDWLGLYEKFFYSKYEIFKSKFGPFSKDMQISFVAEYQQLFALKLIFDSRDLKGLNVDKRIKELSQVVKNAMELIQKDGIILADNEYQVNFVHRTFAEFLVAKWLVSNHNKHKEACSKLIEKIFEPDYTFVRNIFDKMLARDCEMHVAIINGEEAKVKELLSKNSALALLMDNGGRSVLHLLASWGVKLLLPQRGQLIDPDVHRKTAKEVFNKKLCESVLNLGIALNKDLIMGLTPIDYAIKNGCFTIADAIISKFSSPVIIKRNLLPHLYYCARYGYAALMDTLLNSNDRRKWFMTLIQPQATRSEKMKDYLSGPVDVEGRTLLHWSVMANHFDVTSQLLAMLVDVNTPDLHGRTPLHEAASKGYYDMASSLISIGANINQANDDGMTPLHLASRFNHLRLVKLLLNSGADKTIVDRYGSTAFHWAVVKNKVDVVKIFLDQNIRTLFRSSYNSARGNQSKVKEDPLERSVDDNDFNGISALHLAASKGTIDVLKVLLQHGADPRSIDQDGRSTLHWAASCGQSESIKTLLAAGIIVDCVDTNYRTPLHVAASYGHLDAVKVLVESGADIYATDKNMFTALDLAFGRRFKEPTVKYLQELMKINDDQEPRGYDEDCLTFVKFLF